MSNTAIDLEIDEGVNVTVNDMLHSLLLDENIGLPRSAAAVFSLWMNSGLIGEAFHSQRFVHLTKKIVQSIGYDWKIEEKKLKM